jgi:hypothetical protein
MQNIIGSKFGKWTVHKKSGIKWTCQCECGTRRDLTMAALVRGESSQCQRCYTHRLPEDTSAFNAVLNDYVQQAKRRNLSWALTREEAQTLFKSVCRYCGRAPFQVKRIRQGRGAFTFNGIDRRNNVIGYVAGNCVSCCKVCNWMKRDLTEEEFMEHVLWIAKQANEVLNPPNIEKWHALNEPNELLLHAPVVGSDPILTSKKKVDIVPRLV